MHIPYISHGRERQPLSRRSFLQLSSLTPGAMVLVDPRVGSVVKWLARGFDRPPKADILPQTQEVIGPVRPHEASAYLRAANPGDSDEALWNGIRFPFWKYADYRGDAGTAHGFQREETLLGIFQEFFSENGYFGEGSTSFVIYDRPFGSPINYDLGQDYPDARSYAEKLQSDLVATHSGSMGNLVIMSPAENEFIQRLPIGEIFPIPMEVPEIGGYVDAVLRQAAKDVHYRSPTEPDGPIRLLCLTWNGTQGNSWINVNEYNIDPADASSRIPLMKNLIETSNGRILILPPTLSEPGDTRRILDELQANFPARIGMSGRSALPPEEVIVELLRHSTEGVIPYLHGAVRGKPEVFLPLSTEMTLNPPGMENISVLERSDVKFPPYQPAPVSPSGAKVYIRIDEYEPRGTVGIAHKVVAISPSGGSYPCEYTINRDASNNPTGKFALTCSLPAGAAPGGGGGCLAETAQIAAAATTLGISVNALIQIFNSLV